MGGRPSSGKESIVRYFYPELGRRGICTVISGTEPGTANPPI